jgi:hypothetical protein
MWSAQLCSTYIAGRFAGVTGEVNFIVNDAKADGEFHSTYSEP